MAQVICFYCKGNVDYENSPCFTHKNGSEYDEKRVKASTSKYANFDLYLSKTITNCLEGEFKNEK